MANAALTLEKKSGAQAHAKCLEIGAFSLSCHFRGSLVATRRFGGWYCEIATSWKGGHGVSRREVPKHQHQEEILCTLVSLEENRAWCLQCVSPGPSACRGTDVRCVLRWLLHWQSRSRSISKRRGFQRKCPASFALPRIHLSPLGNVN